jgi:hypothetical protein
MATAGNERGNNGVPWWAIIIILALLLVAVWWLTSDRRDGEQNLVGAIKVVEIKLTNLFNDKFSGLEDRVTDLEKPKPKPVRIATVHHHHDTFSVYTAKPKRSVVYKEKPQSNVVYVDNNVGIIGKIAAACAPLPIVSDGNGGFRCDQRFETQASVAPVSQTPSQYKNCHRNDRGELMCDLSNNWKWYAGIGCAVGYAITKTGLGCAYVGVGAGVGSAVGERAGGQTGSHVGGVIGGIPGGLLSPHATAAALSGAGGPANGAP